MISSYLPYPLYSGGHVRLFNLIKELSKKHEITLVCEKRPYQTNDHVKEVKRYCHEVIVFPRKKQWSLGNIQKTAFSKYPFLMVGHTIPIMEEKITELLQKNTFDLIHIETFYVMQNLPFTIVPVVLVEHNIEYLVYERFKKRAPAVLRPLLAIDIKKIKYWEALYWQRATKLVAVSEVEKNLMKRDDVEVVPNGVDIHKFRVTNYELRGKKKEKRILFIGDFKWVQNRDTARWIIKEIWPVVARALAGKPNITLWIVGKHIPESIKRLTNDTNVIFDENASDKTEEIYQQADVLLAPIRVGGGTSYKILEAMASGVAVVTTPLGIEGLTVTDGKDVLTGKTAESLAKQVEKLVDDEKLFTMIIKNARKRIEDDYDWKKIAKKLDSVYESVK